MKAKLKPDKPPEFSDATKYKLYWQKKGPNSLNGATVVPCTRPVTFFPQNRAPGSCPFGAGAAPDYPYSFKYDHIPINGTLFAQLTLCEWIDTGMFGPSSAVLRLSTFLGLPAWTIDWVDLHSFETATSFNFDSRDGTGAYTPASHWTDIIVG